MDKTTDSTDTFYYERATSEVRLEKIKLLSQLYNITKEPQDPNFIFIDTSVKNLDPDRDIQQIIESKKRLRLKQSDWDKLNQIFTDLGVQEKLKAHLKLALHDAFVILTLPKSAVRHY